MLERLCERLHATRPKVLPKSPSGETLAYPDHQWAGFIRYCKDGRLEIDSNRFGNAIRPFVLGRKN